MESGISKGQGRLIDEVINKGLCVRCGACVGFCPYFHYFDGEVVVVDHCNADTWRCLQLCPRGGYKETSIDIERVGDNEIADIARGREEIGPYQKVIIARSIDKDIRKRAQYGGVVSALLIYSLERGFIRSAILTDAGNHLSPGGFIARNRLDVLKCAGSRYSGSGSLTALNKAISSGEDKVGVVGVPCQMEALARMALMRPDGEEKSNRIVLKIGLFCTWAVDYRQFDEFLRKEGVEEYIKKYDIPPPPSEKFQVQTEKRWIEFPLSDIRPLIQKGCNLCQDMTAEWADISVGTVEGREGWNTILVRTDVGSELVNAAIEEGWIETNDLPKENLEHLKQAALNKRKRAKKAEI